MYPAPPVTRTLCPIPSLQTEQPLQGVEQPVPPAGPRRLLQGDGGLVEELVQQRLAEVLDLAAILGAQVREAAQGALELSGAHRLHPVAELAQDGHHRQAAVPPPEALHLLGHDPLGRRDVVPALGSGMRRHGLEVIEIVQEHVLELRDRGLHVPWDGEIDNAQRSSAAAPDGRSYAVPRHDRVRGGRRAEHDVTIAEVVPRFIQRERSGAQLFGDRLGPLVRAVCDQRDAHPLGHEACRGQLGDVTGAENQSGATRELSEDLGGHGDRRGRGRRRAGGETGLAAHAGAHQQRGLEQAVQDRARHGLGDVPGLSHLPLNLRLAQDHGIEARRHTVQMPHGVAVALDVAVLAGAGPDAQALREQRPHRFGNGVVRLGQVELGAVARREQHAAARPGGQHPLERLWHLPRRMGEALAHLEGRGAVIHAQDRDAHVAVAQRNRWVPGVVSLSARYTSSTAAKLAMLANAARRPAQCRTRRTPTVHPSTSHMSIPHTTCAASTGTPPAYRTPNPSSTPRVTVGNPTTKDRWFSWSSRSRGGNSRKTWPNRFAFSSRNCSRYSAAAMNASASMARPKMLMVMCRIDHGLRPTTGRASGTRPMSRASPMSPVASGPVKTPTADARNAASLATWNSARNSASRDSVGATPMNGVSRATPSACAAMPASGTPKSRPRGAGRSPAKGASTNTVATAYRPRATK